MKKTIAIIGPTSTGKTDLALHLAKEFNGELISCDSRQVYVGLDLGTGKLPDKNLQVRRGEGCWIMNGIKVWMYDVVSPKKQYTVADYVKEVTGVIRKIRERGKLPIIVGGTGLYLKALIEGLPNLGIPANPSLRKKLEKLSLEELQKRLQELSLKRWNLMNNSDRQNPRRLIRAIEMATVRTKRFKIYDLRFKNFNILKIGLTAPRDILYKRIDERVIARINEGMIDEAKSLNKKGLSFKRMKQLGLEYGVLADFLQKKIAKNELIKILQGKIHSYARRQITWFKKEKGVDWFDITDKNYESKVEKLVSKWYHLLDAAQD